MAAQSSVPLGHSERRGDSSLIWMIDIASFLFVWTCTTGQIWEISSGLRCESLFLSLSFTTICHPKAGFTAANLHPVFKKNSLSQVSSYANHGGGFHTENRTCLVLLLTSRFWHLQCFLSVKSWLRIMIYSTLQRHNCKWGSIIEKIFWMLFWMLMVISKSAGLSCERIKDKEWHLTKPLQNPQPHFSNGIKKCKAQLCRSSIPKLHQAPTLSETAPWHLGRM